MTNWPKIKLWWDDSQTGVRHELISELPITLGRDGTNTVRLESGLVSRQHAEIFAEGDSLIIRDVSSTNGVKVNGKQVSQTVLRQGDTFKIGAVHFNWGFDLPSEEDDDLSATVVDYEPPILFDDSTEILPPRSLGEN